MRRFFIVRESHKKIISIVTILFLLPYILTVFINGKEILDGNYQSEGEVVIVEVDGVQQEVLWEEYLLGVLANTIPVDCAFEAMKAQAVIIRTNLCIESNGEEEYVFNTPFLAVGEIEEKWSLDNSLDIYSELKQAVAQTQGEVLVVEDELVHLPYHYLSAGFTRDGMTVLGGEGYDYLIKVSCPLDVESEDYLHVHEISYIEIANVLSLTVENDELCYEDFVIGSTDESGYVMQIMVQGESYSGETFADLLELESSAFSLQESSDKLKLSVVGMGHGLGLSQNTATYMALEGKTYEEILQYFYIGGQVIEY